MRPLFAQPWPGSLLQQRGVRSSPWGPASAAMLRLRRADSSLRRPAATGFLAARRLVLTAGVTLPKLAPTPISSRHTCLTSSAPAGVVLPPGRKRNASLVSSAAAVYERPTKRTKGPAPRPRNLVEASVAPATLRQYQSEVAEFKGWASAHGRRTKSPALCDQSLRAYFEWLMQQREAPQVGRWALFGTMLLEYPELGRGAQVFPLARTALRGWTKLFPGRVRDPCPVIVAWLIGCHFLALNTKAGLFLACAVALQVDAYLRPGTLFNIRHEDLLRPHRAAGARYQRWALVLAPSTRVARTKTGEQDDTVSVGIADRSFVQQIAGFLVATSAPGKRVFGTLNLHTYELEFKRVCSSLGLDKLRLVPHSLRHAGPSHDRFHRHLSLPEIQDRGKWNSPLSVKRYEKHATLLRQLALLSPSQARAARVAAAEFPQQLAAKMDKFKKSGPP